MHSLTIYYDGQCALCLAEIHFLKARNRRGLLDFIDFNQQAFDEGRHDISCACAMEKIHARLSDGELLTGVPVFAEAYRRADLPLLAWLLSRVWLKPVFNAGYFVFARYRAWFSRAIGPFLLRSARRRYPS
jgi:predicted DCC family thiol-disulfide oxidoreductase YuxK